MWKPTTATVSGGVGVKITKPLFLDTPGSTVGLSSPDLFVVPNRQNNSDYYRIGFGVDLTKLFNEHRKTSDGGRPVRVRSIIGKRLINSLRVNCRGIGVGNEAAAAAGFVHSRGANRYALFGFEDAL
jgi:hypothetical protein